MAALELDRLGSEFNACQQIFQFQVRELSQHLFKPITARQVLEQRFHWIPQSADDRFAVANQGINRDAFEKRIHYCILPFLLPPVKLGISPLPRAVGPSFLSLRQSVPRVAPGNIRPHVIPKR